MTLQEFNENYEYQSDTQKFGRKEVWEIIRPVDGRYYGDCESYCLTVNKLVPGFEDAELHYCKINGVGHCVMVSNGMVLDCNNKKWQSLNYYTTKYKMTELSKYCTIGIVYRLLVTKLLGYVPTK